MRPRPNRIERLPEQYFTSLLARVAATAREPGEPLIDLGRGNPDIPPPAHIVDALVESAREHTPSVHGYAPFAGLPDLREAIAERYASVYGVELDPHREVAVVPGTKTALVEVALCVAGPGDAIALPDPGYPDYRSAVALAGAEHMSLPLDEAGRPEWDALTRKPALVYLNYPSNPTGAAAPNGVFAEAIALADWTDGTVLHDFAYGDLVLDGRRRRALSPSPAREVGVSSSRSPKSYGMAGWRLGFVLGNEELVSRVTWLQEHVRAGIFVALAGSDCALTGPQETVDERRALYEGTSRPGRRGPLALSPRCGDVLRLARAPGRLVLRGCFTRPACCAGEGFGARGRGRARLSSPSRTRRSTPGSTDFGRRSPGE